MAIALYSTTDIHVTNASTTVDGGTGANRSIIFVVCGDTTDNMTAVTWNSEALTKGITQNFAAVGRYNYIWYLHNPSGTGSQSLTISGSTARSVGTCYVYTGVNAAPTDFVANTASAASIANSHTAANGDWLVGGAGNDASTLSAGSNTTLRSVASSQGSGDSNGAASPTALNWTCTPTGNMAAYGCVISPAAEAVANAKFLMFM